MQSDRRHELESNDLAESVTAVTERIRPYIGTIGLGVVALALAAAAWSLVESRRRTASEESWDACVAAMNSGQAAALADTAARYRGTPAAQWAGLVLADGALSEGTQLLFTDRPRGEERLRTAVSAFRELLDSAPPRLVAERATFGLAKARESLGSLEEARRGYEAVMKDYPGSAVERFAEARISALDREATRQWYDWFAQQKPAPPTSDGATPSSPQPDSGTAGPATGEPASGTGAGAGPGTDASGPGG